MGENDAMVMQRLDGGGDEANGRQSALSKESDKGGGGGFCASLYNSKEGTIFGRKPGSWGKLLGFYCVFYLLLAGFFSMMLAVYLQTLDQDYPMWQGDSSIISRDHGSGWGPGMGFLPRPDDLQSTLIWIKKPNQNQVRGEHVKQLYLQLNNTFNEYERIRFSEDLIACDSTEKYNEDEKACLFKIDDLKPCKKEDEFGYPDGQPCILLRLNRIYGWKPEPYTSTTPNPDDPDAVPDTLDNYLKKTNQEYDGQHVYVTCDGEDPVDKENLGKVQIIPKSGISFQFFPYKMQRGYLSPLVALRLNNPRRNTLMSIVCRAYAKNIGYNKDDRLGSTRFELLIED